MFQKIHNRNCILIAIFTITVILIYFNRSERPIEIKNLETISKLLLTNRTTDKLFDLDLKYSIQQECRGELLAVIVITSYFGNIETRSAMRRAFSEEQLAEHKIKRVFLLGYTQKDRFVKQNAIENEAERFRDIIQGNFHEAYRNLTYKHLMGLKWASDHCKGAKYIIKMDDDIVINFKGIVRLLKEIKLPEKNLLAGYVLRGMLPKRDKANKWYVTYDEYSDDNYPTFLSGWFYVTEPTTARKLVALSRYRKYFWIDDTYVTGILAAMIKVRHYSLAEFFTLHPEILRCCMHDAENYGYDCEFLVGPNGGDSNLFFDFNRAMGKCFSGDCAKRGKPLDDTCVAERKINLGKGVSVIKTFPL